MYLYYLTHLWYSTSNMSPEQRSFYPIVETFPDGRKPLHELYASYFKLQKYGWTAEPIPIDDSELPIIAFLSPTNNQEPVSSFWILGGIHGEEPAPAHAFAQEIETIQALHTQGIPVVAILMANPGGYCRDYRYIDKARRSLIGHPGKSVGDAEHLLPHPRHEHRPRKKHPTNPIAFALTSWILKTSTLYPPLFVINHHEDELHPRDIHHDGTYFYSYAYGETSTLQRILPTLGAIMEQSGYELQKNGHTRKGRSIMNGFVLDERDGSIDELLATPTYIQGGTVHHKKPPRAVVTVETIIDHKQPQLLEQRALIHRNVIKEYSNFWNMAQ